MPVVLVGGKVGEGDERVARENSPQPGRGLRGGKVTGWKEIGRKEMGWKETGGKEMRAKDFQALCKPCIMNSFFVI